ncbi:dihydrofolate reductase [Aquibacillus saliphilus]|uniref:dihydrofolate reductase n=1 Tax=Aquibacillus saliphilus TaxID=1909422 RepID=UPI001CF01DCB|nr:dihydrofolate reductase [Aquibacillus saliphilus]
MSFSIIAAVGKNGEIGLNNKLLWNIPEDFQWFKYHTMNKVVIMGRRTYESLPVDYLPKRINVVLTKNKDYKPHTEVMVFHTVDDILHEFANEREVMILGGSEIYKQFLPYTNRMYLTKVDHSFEADSYFPKIDWNDWKTYFKHEGEKDNEYDYCFYVYKKPLK